MEQKELVTNKTLEKLKYDLVRDSLVEYETLEKAQEIAKAQGINIGQALVNSGVIKEEDLLKFIESKLHIPYVNLDDYELDKKSLKYISYQDAKRYKIIPLFKIENVLSCAMADPFDLFAIDKIIESSGCAIDPLICSEASIIKKINENYKDEKALCEIFTGDNSFDFDWSEELHKDDLSEEHLQKVTSAILKQALIEDSHEIFFEFTEQGLGVNFKKNNEITNKGYIPTVLSSAFIVTLKTISNLDPAVSEVPQLGKLNFKIDNIALVASVSTYPTILDERISLKIYKPPKALDKLITDPIMINNVKTSLETPGIILVCGSALSGKTHVIYSLLNEIYNSQKQKNIMTIESIVKYNLKHVNQCELNENVGFNLDKALRFIEFQSPDIIYFEGVQTKEAVDYFSSLVFKGKTIITEFMANNMSDLRQNLSLSDFEIFRSLISCLIFIHSKDTIDVYDKNRVQKYLT